MPLDVTCPKCNYVFPVTQARHLVGVECPGCGAELTVEWRKRPSPVEPGNSPYEALVKAGKPPVGAPDQAAPSRRSRREDDDEERSKGGGGSMAIVMLASFTALLFALGGLSATGYFLFTNLDTSDAALNNLPSGNNKFGSQHNSGNQGGGNQGSGKQGGGNTKGNTGFNKGGPSVPGIENPPPAKKAVYEHRPVTGPLPAIKPPTLAADSLSLPLPSRAGAVAIGGGGRYIVMHFPETGQLGVFDASTALLSLTPTDAGDVRLAAGLSRIVTLVPGNTMRVFSILEPKTPDQKLGISRLYDSPVAGIDVGGIVMGSHTNGPLMGVSTFGGIRLMEVGEGGIKEIVEGRTDDGWLHWHGGVLRATPDSMVYLTCDNFSEKRVLVAFADTNKKLKKRTIEKMVMFPGADGFLYGNGVVTDQKGVDQRYGGVGSGSGQWYVPAVCGTTGAFLKIAQVSYGKGIGAKKVVTVSVHNKGNANTIAEGTKEIAGLPEFEGFWDPFGNAARDKPFDRHFFLFPEAKLLAMLAANKEVLLLRKVDLK